MCSLIESLALSVRSDRIPRMLPHASHVTLVPKLYALTVIHQLPAAESADAGQTMMNSHEVVPRVRPA